MAYTVYGKHDLKDLLEMGKQSNDDVQLELVNRIYQLLDKQRKSDVGEIKRLITQAIDSITPETIEILQDKERKNTKGELVNVRDEFCDLLETLKVKVS